MSWPLDYGAIFFVGGAGLEPACPDFQSGAVTNLAIDPKRKTPLHLQWGSIMENMETCQPTAFATRSLALADE